MSDTKPPPEAVALPDSPTDGITCLQYLSDNDNKSLLASTSWDGVVRVHDTATKSRKFSHQMDSGPLLSLAVLGGSNNNNNNTKLVTGGMDGSIRMVDVASSTTTVIGRHEVPAGAKPSDSSQQQQAAPTACSCLARFSLDDDASDDNNLLVSAGWHKQLHIWDVRASSTPTATIDLPGKAFCMDVDATHNRIVVGTSGRRTCFVDVRSSSTAKLAVDRESSLKYQTRCIQFFPTGDAIAAGSVEGRVAVEYLEEFGLPAKKKYAFKCHRSGEIVYPVNTIAFNPRFGTFATGGCDGCVVMWDGLNKKKLTGLPQFPTSISALAFNHDGSELAIASSYTFEDGEREHPRDEIYIRPMLDSECKPKEKSSEK